MSRLLRRALGALLGLAIGLFGVELAVRLIEPSAPPVDTAVAWQDSPVASKLRLKETPIRFVKPEGRVRILVLGDSFTWGQGVHGDDTYPARLERRLDRYRNGLEFDVLNAGRRGWNTERQYVTLDKQALTAYQPDMVILGYCLNDVEPRRDAALEARRGALERRAPSGRLSSALHRGSRLYRLAWQRLENRRQRRAHSDHYRWLYDPEQPYMARMEKALGRIRDHLRERSIPLLVVIFPIFDSDFDEGYAYRDLHGQVATACARMDIPVLDLLPHFEGMDGDRLAVTPFTDAHPSEIAHRIVADTLYDRLVERLEWRHDVDPVAPVER